MEVYSKEEKDKIIKELELRHKETLERKLKELETEYQKEKSKEEIDKRLKEKELKEKQEKIKETLEKKIKELKEKQEEEKYKEQIQNQIKELQEKKTNSNSSCRQETKNILQQLTFQKENKQDSDSKFLLRKVKELEKQFKELQEKQKEEPETKNEKWIIGEYKWMPTGSIMPKGWIKVNLSKGHTIVQGIEEGITEGNIGKHNHYYGYNNQKHVWTIDKGLNGESNSHFSVSTEGKAFESQYFMMIKDKNTLSNSDRTSSQGDNLSTEQENLAAGIFAELWQYIGIDNEGWICCKPLN